MMPKKMREKYMRCWHCGMCCTDVLPVSDDELRTLREYVKEHGIVDTKVSTITCPFRDKKRRRCNVYEVRPMVCSMYQCGRSLEDQVKKMEILRGTRKPQSIRASIYYTDDTIG